MTNLAKSSVLLAAAGLRPGPEPGQARWYLQCGRWLVRPDRFCGFAFSPLSRWVDLLRTRPRRLASGSAAGRAPLVLVRDDGRPKLSVFELEKRIRHVYFLRRQDFLREMDAMVHFAGIGLAVPPIVGRDDARLYYRQQIVREPLLADSRAGPADVEVQILRLATAANPDWTPVSAYLERSRSAVQAISDYLDAGLRTQLDSALEELASPGSGFDGRMIPLFRCHGDMSTGNVLVGDDGRVYLNDFDRSFVANAWFDAVYYCRTAGLGREAEVRVVKAVTRAIGTGSRLGPGAEQGAVALLTAMDLAAYVHDRLRAVPSGTDRLCRFSLDLMGQILDG